MATQNESIAKAVSTMHSLYQNHYVYDECWQREEHDRIERSLLDSGQRQVFKLFDILSSENRIDDFKRAGNDSAFLKQLLNEHGLH